MARKKNEDNVDNSSKMKIIPLISASGAYPGGYPKARSLLEEIRIHEHKYM